MDQYLKMVLALPAEFFAGWEWKAGDKAILSEKEVLVLGIQNEYVWYYDRGELVFSLRYIKNDVAMIHKSEIVPIPTQKQLQSMLNLNPIEFIEDLYAYSQEPLLPNMDNEQFKTDLDCFTLAYVVDRKFKKYWDGEKWL